MPLDGIFAGQKTALVGDVAATAVLCVGARGCLLCVLSFSQAISCPPRMEHSDFDSICVFFYLNTDMYTSLIIVTEARLILAAGVAYTAAKNFFRGQILPSTLFAASAPPGARAPPAVLTTSN